MLIVDATQGRKFELGREFDHALLAYELAALLIVAELAQLADRWPPWSPLHEIMKRQHVELLDALKRMSTLRYLELSRARQSQV